MSNTASNHFSFNLALNKAFEKNGEFYLETDVSDTRLDYHDQHMTEKALDSMVSMLKNGFPEPDGKLQKVYLLDNHSATFEMGYAEDGKITKSADGHFDLSATWKLIKDNPQAMQLYKEVASGECKKQLSVGGEAMGHAYFNETLGKTVGSLDDVVKLEHVACTRPGKAAVSSTGFIGAMLKSIEGLGAERIAFEKSAMTDAARKSSASVVWDNTKSHDFLVSGDKLYLAPVPDGDRMAAKVAISNLHSWPFTNSERKVVHDKAAAVLGDEHKTDNPYCSYCSKDQSFYNSIDTNSATTPQGAPITITKGTEGDMEQKQFDDFKLATEKSQIAQTASIEALTTLVKSLMPPPAKTAEEIAVEKAASDAAIANAPMTMAGLTAILEKSNATLVASLMAPGARTQTSIPAGATAVSKSTEDVVAEALRLAAGNQTAASENLTKKKEQLALLGSEREMIIEKRRSMAKFTGAEDFAAQVLEKKYSLLRTEIHLEEATGVAV